MNYLFEELVERLVRADEYTVRGEMMHLLIEKMRAAAIVMTDAMNRDTEAPMLLGNQIWWISRLVKQELEAVMETGASEESRVTAAMLLIDIDPRKSKGVLLRFAQDLEGDRVIPVVSALLIPVWALTT